MRFPAGFAAANEDSIYRALGMGPLAGTLQELVADEDIAGILPAHRDRSDFSIRLRQRAEATLNRGYELFGVADHRRPTLADWNQEERRGTALQPWRRPRRWRPGREA
jgi:hypothetical protein